MSDAIEPFHLAVPKAALDDLRQRLAQTRWPEPETVGDWSQGAPLTRVQALCACWRDQFGLSAILGDYAASRNLRPSRSRPARLYI